MLERKNDLKVTKEEIKQFVAILFFTGYHHLPPVKLMWDINPDCMLDIVHSTMCKTRFWEIRNSLISQIII